MVRQRSKITYLYVALTSIFLLTFGPFNTKFVSFIHEWNIIAVSVCSLIGFIFLVRDRAGIFKHSVFFVVICVTYAGVIIANSLFHLIALHASKGVTVNVIGESALQWMHSTSFLTFFYLFFPVLFLLQLPLLRRLELRVVIRVFSLVIMVSLLVLFYQKYFDMSFFNKSYFLWINRAGGLSHDANSFAMTAFLLIPLFMSGIVLEGVMIFRAYYAVLVLLLGVGMTFTGNRTALGGLLLFFACIPAVIALLRRDMPRRRRLIFIVILVLCMLAAILLLYPLMKDMDAPLPSVERFVTTVEEIVKGRGIEKIVRDDQRGTNFVVAWDMMKDAPLAGWGPSGFHRESSTYYFIRTKKKHISDSALNHYLMIAADLGLPVLFLNCILLIVPIIMAIYAVRKTAVNKRRYILAFIITANIIFLFLIITIPPTFFPGLAWVWTALLAHMVVTGEDYNIRISAAMNHRVLWVLITAGTIVAVVTGAYQTTFGTKGYISRQNLAWWPYRYERNCYSPSQWEGNVLRWCKNESFVQFVINPDRQYPEVFRAKLMVAHPDLEKNPVVVKYGGKEGTVNEILFQESRVHEIEIPVKENYVYEYMGIKEDPRRFFVLSLDVSRTWVPREWGVSEDRRELGVALITPPGNHPFDE